MEKKKIKMVVLSALAVIAAVAACFCAWKFILPGIKQETEIVPVSALKDGNTAHIVLKQDKSTVSGTGASVSGNKIVISQGGNYYITGTLEDGQIYVDAGKNDKVILSLAGTDISNSSDAPVYIENAGYTSVFLEEGTKNLLQSGKAIEITATEDDNNGTGAALYACDDLNITGTGSLSVYGYINNGIYTKNNLLIDSGNIVAEAVNNGIKGKDSIKVTGGDINIISGGDGVKSDDTTGEGYGTVSIEGGTFQIESKGDAVQAETLLSISNGNFTVISGGGSENAVYEQEKGWGEPDSGWDAEDGDEASMKGFKSGTGLKISGGTFSIDSQDDAFHSNGDAVISGGTFKISTGDDGIHADTELVVENGNIQIIKAYEGIEANKISIQNGDINIISLDDGINACGGQNTHGFGRPGGIPGGFTEAKQEEAGETTEEMPELLITGGNIYVCADGDGLDSNGNIIIEAGTLVVDGPSGSGNGAIDTGSENGGTCKVNGGTVIAIGSSGMAETFDETSGQYSFCHNFENQFAANDLITIADTKGNEIYSHKAAKTGNSIVFSSPGLKHGSTYTLKAGSQSVEITLEQVSTISGEQGGMLVWGEHKKPGFRREDGGNRMAR